MPKPAKHKTDNVVTMASLESPTAVPTASVMPQDDIARRAYELYCDRGREDGHDVDDWLNAERELQDGASFSAA
jgi:hypothetical protein